MKKEVNYISDQELEQLILQVEQEELVTAPPDLMESILEAAGLVEETVQETSMPANRAVSVKSVAARKKEFYAYCFRVITSVAAAVVLVFLLPEISGVAGQEVSAPAVSKQEVPSFEEVADAVPSRENIVLAEQTPTRDEVLNDTGFIERVLNSIGWFGKHNSKE